MIVLKNANRRREEKKRRNTGSSGYNGKKLWEKLEAAVTMEKIISKKWFLELPRSKAGS